MNVEDKKRDVRPVPSIEVVLETEAAEPDPRDRMSDTDKKEIAKLTINHIRRHARAHGSFTGFADFLAQCDLMISQTRAGRNKIAVTLANSLARDISSIRDMTEGLPPETRALLFRGFTTGYLFANLRREKESVAIAVGRGAGAKRKQAAPVRAKPKKKRR